MREGSRRRSAHAGAHASAESREWRCASSERLGSLRTGETDLQKSEEGGEREREWKGPLSMYEAINLARQIASSLVRSQANC